MNKAKFNLFGTEYSIGLDSESEENIGVFERKEFRKRYRALQHKITGDAARTIKARLIKGLPTDGSYDELRKAFEVSRVETPKNKFEAAHVVHADPKSKRIARSSRRNTLVYIKVLGNSRGDTKAAQVLEKYGPWPLDLLPFEPKSSVARVVHRNVNAREVATIRRNLNENLAWKTELSAVTRPSRRSPDKRDKRKDVRSIPDLSFQFKRLEFGLGGEPNLALMRKNVLRYVKKDLPSKFKGTDSYMRVFTRPRFTKWTKWEPETKMTMSMDRVKNYMEFQKKLGLHISGGG